MNSLNNQTTSIHITLESSFTRPSELAIVLPQLPDQCFKYPASIHFWTIRLVFLEAIANMPTSFTIKHTIDTFMSRPDKTSKASYLQGKKPKMWLIISPGRRSKGHSGCSGYLLMDSSNFIFFLWSLTLVTCLPKIPLFLFSILGTSSNTLFVAILQNSV